MSAGPFHAVKVEFARPFLNLPRSDTGTSVLDDVDYRDVAARELSMLAKSPVDERRRRRRRRP